MAKLNVLETVTYGRVSYMCSLQSCDAHILGSTLWSRTPDITVVAGLIVGAKRYNCASAPCIVDDVGQTPKIWYAGLIDDFGYPCIWCVEHSCKLSRQGKRIEYYEWPIVPTIMIVADAPAIKTDLLPWIPNSMASACVRAKALDFLVGQLGFTVENNGWLARIDLTKDPLLKSTTGQE